MPSMPSPYQHYSKSAMVRASPFLDFLGVGETGNYASGLGSKLFKPVRPLYDPGWKTYDEVVEETKDMDSSSYRYSRSELKELGFTSNEIAEILEHPLHTQKKPTKKTQKKALDVYDAQSALLSPISSTLGRAGTAGMEGMLGEKDIGLANLSEPEIQEYLDSIKSHTALKDVGLYLGSHRGLDRLKRVWKNPNIGVFNKVVNTIASPLQQFMVSATRADHYDPTSNTVTLFHNLPSVLAHEMGHAVDWNTAKDPFLANVLRITQGPLASEYLASNLAINSLAGNYLNKDIGSAVKAKAQLSTLNNQAKQLRKAYDTYQNYYGGGPKQVRDRYQSDLSDLEFFLTAPETSAGIKKLLKKHKVK